MDTNDQMYDYETNDFHATTGQVTESQSIPVYATVQTYPCSICGRRFNTESLRKHQGICKKGTQKQPRRIFDAGKQRATDSDVPYKATRETTQFYKEGRKPKAEEHQAKTSKWREGHDELVRTIRHARQVTHAIETGAPVPKTIPSQAPSDYIQCDYCHRHFNKYSAERHIPFCETQFKRKQSNAMLTNNVRTPPRNNGRAERVDHAVHQINSAPSKLVTRKPQRTIEEKDYSRPTVNANAYRRLTYQGPMKTAANGLPADRNTHRPIKTRQTTGNYLRSMRPTDRLANTEQEQPKAETSSYYQQHIAEMKNRAQGLGQRPTQTDDEFEQPEAPKAKVPTVAKHCHQCGEAFPVEWAKFCCECGEKRFGME